jgi:hypothetical protein
MQTQRMIKPHQSWCVKGTGRKWVWSEEWVNKKYVFCCCCFCWIFTPFSPQFRGIQLLVATLLSHRYNSLRARERRRLKVMRPPIHNPTKPHCFLTQRVSNPEASRTNVSEETPCTWQPWFSAHCARPATGVAGAQWEKDIHTGQTLPNPDDARPIARCPTDLPVAAG